MSIKEEYAEIVKLLDEEEKKCLPELPDYWETSPAIKAEIELFTRDLHETVRFLDHDCTAEQLIWLSDVFEEISAKLQSWEFIDASKRAADRFPEECKTYNIRECISFAEGQLDDAVYETRYPRQPDPVFHFQASKKFAGKNCVILKWNPAISSFPTLAFLKQIIHGTGESDWSVWEHEKVKPGDQFFMLKVGVSTCGIVAEGKITGKPVRGPDWSGKGRKVYYCDYIADFMVNPAVLPILESRELAANIPDFDWTGGHSGVILSESQAEILRNLFDRYLNRTAMVFQERLARIALRSPFNDQLYLSKKLLACLHGSDPADSPAD